MARKPTPATKIQRTLTKTRIGRDLIDHLDERDNKKTAASGKVFPVIIEFNRDFCGGAIGARNFLRAVLDESFARVSPPLLPPIPTDQPALRAIFHSPASADFVKSEWTDTYLFARLTREGIAALANQKFGAPLVYKVWRDHPIKRCVYESVRTIKCDAAQASFAASGKGIVWAVADTGISGEHPHFKTLKTLEDLSPGLSHLDFTGNHPNEESAADAALIDEDGHGTHVAGIIAGRTSSKSEPLSDNVTELEIISSLLTESGRTKKVKETFDQKTICGVAPYTKLLSLKVLSRHDEGLLSNLLAAIGYIQRKNDNGRNLKIHGVNISLGYAFDPEWFAAGQSPLCVDIDRLVRSGVVVVVAAGNAGYGSITQYNGAMERAAHVGTIMDPGNAELAITVGSTHRDMPHRYGVSFFSSKGPTSDGRMKPDLVAPGERIISCALPDPASPKTAHFREDSGTSQAAPHVSGAIAAFLSVRMEFQGQPERIKEIFLGSATDLRRRAEFQGAGLVDLMRSLQSV